MLYSIGDQFLVRNVVCEVRFINNGKAWLFPVEDSEYGEDFYITCLAYEVLDNRGRTRSGEKAAVVVNARSGAV